MKIQNCLENKQLSVIDAHNSLQIGLAMRSGEERHHEIASSFAYYAPHDSGTFGPRRALCMAGGLYNRDRVNIRNSVFSVSKVAKCLLLPARHCELSRLMTTSNTSNLSRMCSPAKT